MRVGVRVRVLRGALVPEGMEITDFFDLTLERLHVHGCCMNGESAVKKKKKKKQGEESVRLQWFDESNGRFSNDFTRATCSCANYGTTRDELKCVVWFFGVN